MDRMAILAKPKKRHSENPEGGGVATTPLPLLRERVNIQKYFLKQATKRNLKLRILA